MWKWIGLGAACLAMSGCGMLPVEEEAMAPPVLKTYESVEYGLYTVRRGDMQNWKTIRVNSVAKDSEEIFFEIAGVKIDEILVEVGDVVQAGDVLVRLERAQAEAALERTQEALGRALVRRSDAKQMYELDMYEAVFRRNEAEVSAWYQSEISKLDGEVRKLEIERDEWERKLAQRELRAGMSGVVTVIRSSLREGTVTTTAERAITIVDAGSSLFVVTGENAQYFTAGARVTVETASGDYDVTVLESESSEIAYLAADEGVTVSEGLSGTVRMLVDEKEGVLLVPKAAVRTVGEESYVFMLEEGLRVTRSVEIGMQTETETEIVAGLAEGEEIISGGIR